LSSQAPPLRSAATLLAQAEPLVSVCATMVPVFLI
jgi:hypothetical protein